MAGEEECVRCNEVGQDRRTLWVSCFYALEEISSKLQVVTPQSTPRLYTARICKDCRGEFLGMLRDFLELPPMLEEDRPDANIPVRVLGRTVMMTEGEYWTWRRNQTGT